MNRFWPICLSVFVGLSGWEAVSGKDVPATAEQLMQQFKSALQAKDKDAILALYNWDGVAGWVKAYQGDDVDDWLTRDVKSVNLSPLPAGFSSTGQTERFRFHLNVQPAGIIEAHFADGFGVGFPYGTKNGHYYIATVLIDDIPFHETGTNKIVIVDVRTAEGSPLPHIRVITGDPSDIPFLHFKALMGNEFLADEQGRVILPQPATNLYIVAANKSGFGWLPSGAITNGAALVLYPWARIEGTWKNRNRPMAGETLELSIDRDLYPTGPIRISHMETRTDADGHFVFTNVPPLKLQIKRMGLLIASLDLTSGGTKDLEIDTHGRTVLGKVIAGNGFSTNIDLADFSGTFNSAVSAQGRTKQTMNFQASSNGSFEMDPVEPGDYTISGNIWEGNSHIAILNPVSIHVPEVASDSAEAPFDLGSVTVSPVVHLKPGDMAPDFTAATVDGRALKLSDFRGKYVLLDFWATWCFWCVKEMPNLKATYDAFGANSRLAMVSLSLDSNRAAPRRYAQRNEIHWTQGFLGDWSDDKVAAQYGVFGIPAIFLIGPDGRILATDLRGDKIKEAVASALARGN